MATPALLRLTLTLIIACSCLGSLPAAALERPRLVLLIVIDQFREDYLYRFYDHFLPPVQADGQPGGFRYLLEGAWHRQCFWDTYPTETAVGHACLVTGSGPRQHGVVSNTWYDHQLARVVDVLDDPSFPLALSRHRPAPRPQGELGISPHRLMGTTFGDELKRASPPSKVVSIAVKDRAATMMAGHSADLALWYDRTTGNWISSRYYCPQGLPPWVEGVNAQAWPDQQFDWVWEPLLPPLAERGTTLAAGPGASDMAGLDEGFPHAVRFNLDRPGPAFYEILMYTPLTMEYTLRMAREAVTHEKLGADEVPDVLLVSLSPNDLLGHQLGPYSHEMQDFVLRTDRELARLFGQLQKDGILASTVIALSADHGVAPLPPGSKRLDPKLVEQRMEEALARVLGPGDHVLNAQPPEVYLATHARTPEAVEAARVAAESVPGIYRALNTLDMRPGEPLANSVHPGRSPEILLVLDPFWLATGRSTGTSHGTPWTYDTHVPLVVRGPGIKAGQYHERVTPRDLAPTLSELLWITPPSMNTGRSLLK